MPKPKNSENLDISENTKNIKINFQRLPTGNNALKAETKFW